MAVPLHIAKCVRRVREQHFGDRIISHHFSFPRPPQSPDLTHMDFWLWEFINFRVYICNPQTLSELKDSIKREIANIPHTMLRSALLPTISRMQCIITCDGTHVENV